MALSQEKKGGPHTKKDQKERKDRVYELHFEKGISAVKIAETLSVNRNTVNEDIREWYVKVSEELPEQNSSLLLKQIQRVEMQYSKLAEELDKCKDFKEKIASERLMFAVSSKITSETSKIAFYRPDVLRDVKLRIKNPTKYEFNKLMKM